MFGVGPLEAVVLLILALLVLGPEKLPGFVADVRRFAATVHAMVVAAREEVRTTLEPELRSLDLDDLLDHAKRVDDRSAAGSSGATALGAPVRPRAATGTGAGFPPSYPDAT